MRCSGWWITFNLSWSFSRVDIVNRIPKTEVTDFRNFTFSLFKWHWSYDAISYGRYNPWKKIWWAFKRLDGKMKIMISHRFSALIYFHQKYQNAWWGSVHLFNSRFDRFEGIREKKKNIWICRWKNENSSFIPSGQNWKNFFLCYEIF